MDAALLTAIGGGLTGLGGLAAVLKVFTDAKASKRKDDTEETKVTSTASNSAAELATKLNSSAQDWIEYIDGKFDEVSSELTKVNTDYMAFKASTTARDAARVILHQAHQAWDFTMKSTVEKITGDRMADPPPLDVPPQ